MQLLAEILSQIQWHLYHCRNGFWNARRRALQVIEQSCSWQRWKCMAKDSDLTYRRFRSGSRCQQQGCEGWYYPFWKGCYILDLGIYMPKMINHKLKTSIIYQSVETNTKIDQTIQMRNILCFSERETLLRRCLASAIHLCLQISGSDALCLYCSCCASTSWRLTWSNSSAVSKEFLYCICWSAEGSEFVERNHHLEIWWYRLKC